VFFFFREINFNLQITQSEHISTSKITITSDEKSSLQLELLKVS